MEYIDTIITFFNAGGIFMYPILIIMAIGTAIVIEKSIFLLKSSVDARPIWSDISSSISSNKVDDAIRSCEKIDVPICRMFLSGLKCAKRSQSMTDIENSIEETLLETMPKLERRTHYLPVLANIATLLGLLGTIIGLIQAFQAISVAEPSQKAALLAQGVSVAMNTTAFGLIVAIPLLMSYSFLQSRTLKIVDSLDEFSLKFMNLVSGKINEGEKSFAKVNQ